MSIGLNLLITLAFLIVSFDVSPLLLAMPLCAGACAFCIHNETAFWIAQDMWKVDSRKALLITCVPETVTSVIVFVLCLIFQQSAHFLPGLY